ncbi:MAG: NADPH:quinone oxidoreductase [Candidatus Muproteobacteria bacterium RBG_16_60_9]|uniref:NADPH:quinone oxidoreductase n=1 Tax=Candidatus Muproteobacteria bacterium RBG_16_60_9 TaxID=1817755 RepID=A0A1F6UZF8_9PROT|nr:MAG: NADPH:quinone oxidoreductase [Candidatus Muproteobacteria bacterium RBG_16_60_9]
MQRLGLYPRPPGASRRLGLEIVGEVVRPAGRWKKGERVMAVIAGGGYAQLATVPAAQAMPVPDAMSYEQAAALPEAYQTAYLNMFLLGKLKRGESVLVHAGASGVGTAAIQLARAAGARVLVTAGTDDKLAFCRDLGAEVLINYKKEKFSERVLAATDKRGVDLILDFIGASYWNDNLTALANYGRMTIIGFLGGDKGELNLGLMMRKSLTVMSTTLRRTPADKKEELIKALGDFANARFKSGELKPIVDSVYPLERAADAHRHMESNRNIGKIVLKVD